MTHTFRLTRVPRPGQDPRHGQDPRPGCLASGSAVQLGILPPVPRIVWSTLLLVLLLLPGSRCLAAPPWSNPHSPAWSVFGPGDYVGPARMPPVPLYALRVDDQLDFVYRLTHVELDAPYELNVGDQIRVESLTDPKIDRELIIGPYGNITLPLLGQVRAARRTVDELRADLEERYREFYKLPAITVTPLKVNSRLESLRAAVDSRYGRGGQSFVTRVAPDGTVQLPGLGSIPAVGLTLEELKREIDVRYDQFIPGIEVTPVLVQRAPSHVFVVGEVRRPGRFPLEGPTTVMQAIALAGGWNNGGNLRHVVVFRRDDAWRLMATRLDIQPALLGKRPCPADEIWLRDSDIVLVPKSSLLWTTDGIELLFTRGLYGIVPANVSVNLNRLNTLP